MRRILVTGGAGFIGSHLCERLVRDGHDVVCLDNYFTGAKSNVEHLLGYPNFEIMRFDVREPIKIEVDQIYNLACPASPVHYQTQPVRTVETSVMGAVNLLRLARETGAIVLQASTSEVYGDAQVQPQDETYYGHVNPIGIRACYDEGKRCAETICFDYHRQYGVRVKVVRIFNTYGPRLAPGDGRVVSNFILQALRNKPITVYGDGSQTRSLCYVDDLVGGLVAMMESPDEVTGPINLGNPGEYTVLELAEKIIAMTGSKSQIEYRELPQDDPQKRRPDITRAAEVLKWRPHIELDIGLARTIGYFRRQFQLELDVA
ncbi:UDP-glucuronic acid decarboxylase family protein [Phenylobacterium sp.]|uniref:UDP-glucuronic acid decarboxylase family protein n=1 Tax=Phenylobacterium sp. TaxID=1871053 RepID=UPI00391B6A59